MAENIPKLRFPGFTEPWEQRKLGELFEQTTTLVDPVNQGLPLWSLTVEKGLIPKPVRYDRSAITKKDDKYKLVNPGEIVFNPMNMTIGAIGYNDKNYHIAVSGYYVTMKEKAKIAPLFFSEWMVSPTALKLYGHNATGSLIEKQRVQFSTFSKIRCAMPKTEEQNQIGSFLGEINKVITLHQRKLDNLQKLKSGLVQKMFPRDGETVPEVRFPEFTCDWEQRKLGEVSKQQFGGGTPSTQNQEYWSGSLPWFQSSDLELDVIDAPMVRKKITEEAVKNSAAKRIPGDSIAVVTRVGVGKLAYIEYEYSTSQDFLSLSRLDAEPIFLAYQLQKLLKEAKQQGTAIKGITKEVLLACKLGIPNLEEQHLIGSFFSNLSRLITLHQRKLDHLNLLKQGLLQQMFV